MAENFYKFRLERTYEITELTQAQYDEFTKTTLVDMDNQIFNLYGGGDEPEVEILD